VQPCDAADQSVRAFAFVHQHEQFTRELTGPLLMQSSHAPPVQHLIWALEEIEKPVTRKPHNTPASH
jgi:hypothetical protein